MAVGIVEPKQLEGVGRNDTHREREMAFLEIQWVVAHIKSSVVPRWVDEHIDVGRHDFVDDERFGIGIILIDGYGAGS